MIVKSTLVGGLSFMCTVEIIFRWRCFKCSSTQSHKNRFRYSHFFCPLNVIWIHLLQRILKTGEYVCLCMHVYGICIYMALHMYINIYSLQRVKTNKYMTVYQRGWNWVGWLLSTGYYFARSRSTNTGTTGVVFLLCMVCTSWSAGEYGWCGW